MRPTLDVLTYIPRLVCRRTGKNMQGIDFFVQMHLDGAGVKDCDHWHDDAGIMTHHIGYTLQFEQALQVVDPSIAIPYWEYTIDGADTMNGQSRRISYARYYVGFTKHA